MRRARHQEFWVEAPPVGDDTLLLIKWHARHGHGTIANAAQDHVTWQMLQAASATGLHASLHRIPDKLIDLQVHTLHLAVRITMNGRQAALEVQMKTPFSPAGCARNSEMLAVHLNDPP